MGDLERLSRDEWEAVLYAPLRVYSVVASADVEPMEAQFRRLRDEIEAGRVVFATGTIGHTMIESLAANLDALWDGYTASSLKPRDGLKRAVKVLRHVPQDDGTAIKDWLLLLAVRIAEVRRLMGETSISSKEADVIRDLAGSLGRPIPVGGSA